MKSKSWIIPLLVAAACTKKASSGTDTNHAPTVSVTSEMISADPFTFNLEAAAADRDGDSLNYTWDFGEGTIKEGGTEQTISYPSDNEYIVTVAVSDGKSNPTSTKITISTKPTTVSIDASKTFQTIEGFGGFGAKDVYWSDGPFTSPEFVNTVINDLGVTILRDESPTSLEPVNENNDPNVTDLSRYNLTQRTADDHQPLASRVPYFREMKKAGLEKFVASVWSPQRWMKWNNQVSNGTTQNSAPGYNNNPDNTTNQLKREFFEEFAELCVAYVKILKREADIDLYALSVQNEPRFSQSYQSAVYDGAALRDLIKVVGKRFRNEGIKTKLFLPEDIGWLGGVESMIKPTLDDLEAREYADIVAVHGYDLDGVTAASPSAQTWQTMYSWGAAYNKPLWMTETSGFPNTYEGAMSLAKAMYTAINFGNTSAWLFWSLSTGTVDEYSLMNSAGVKSKRYYVSKNFYRYIRPGATRIQATTAEESKLYPLAFQHDTQKSSTIVLINDDKTTSKAIRLSGTGLASLYTMYVTSANDDATDKGIYKSSDVLLIPSNSVVTLHGLN